MHVRHPFQDESLFFLSGGGGNNFLHPNARSEKLGTSVVMAVRPKVHLYTSKDSYLCDLHTCPSLLFLFTLHEAKPALSELTTYRLFPEIITNNNMNNNIAFSYKV